ncbi:hypothetical protein QCA50_006884 [Cerrena zonata]|uniref:Carboxypeptidase n=1 Tax=Cerrena zonata TaxID=2478898 RepID=A0AAW0GA51_9APHY
MLRLLSFCFIAFTCSVIANVQNPIQIPDHDGTFQTYENALFVPAKNLDSVSPDIFTTLKHPFFPKHSVRIKKLDDFCDTTARGYSGYIDIQARHIFFYFFESRNDPYHDDLVFWTNGGPGCSSSMGLFMELGPCRVQNRDQTVYNPHSWTEKANVFFVDQPIGTGFSYADFGEIVETAEEASKDIAAFIAIFFQHFNEFQGNALHMAGESYGGRVIPIFASEIYDQNKHLVEAGLVPINISSIIIGNGCTDESKLFRAYHDMQCTSISGPPVNTIDNCVQMKRLVPRCEKWFQEACYDTSDKINCQSAFSYCYNAFEDYFALTGLNPYDITQACDDYDENFCYPLTKEIAAFLDRSDIRQTLGVDPVIGNFSTCNLDIAQRFTSHNDLLFPTHFYIGALLDRGVRTLIYVGANDLVCSQFANERMTLDVEWAGQTMFNSRDLREWEHNGTVAGLTRSARNLTFATIYGAGHMVPYDKPQISLELITKWLSEETL